ncbi:MAG TPA: peptidylprolyl isomerase [Planctomycetota bacterium]|jgi:hypothetical protein|nr:peptidylprolyl isomerase [Planctomycetota bacterium]
MKSLVSTLVLLCLLSACIKESPAGAAKGGTVSATSDASKPPGGAAGAAPDLPVPSAAPQIPAKPPTPMPTAEPDKIKVQHCLIGFTGSVPGKAITRTKEEAKALAYDILARARKGEDFDALVKQNTDDSPPGIYGMTNAGKPAAPGYRARTGMVPAFGNVGFKLALGEFGIADYDPKTSPFGWHVIKRVE